jgi:hypothetical protein
MEETMKKETEKTRATPFFVRYLERPLKVKTALKAAGPKLPPLQ